MALHSIKNQYRGINAHLHSYWQNEGGWDGFHTNHIADLMRLMRLQLLPLGYTAEIEQSLQIRRAAELSRPESDISIYDRLPNRPPTNHSLSQQGIAISELMDLSVELAQYRAVAIYGEKSDKPVAWLELLSPSNKPNGQDASYYRDKRLKVLQAGLVFVELDYLHQSPSTFEHLPSYLRRKDKGNAHAYRIVVINPRPSLETGVAYPHEFDVDERIPTLEIPLNGNDILRFDFQAAYDKSYSETLYGMELVDYSQLPLHFEKYSPDDQTRIAARIIAVLTNAANLESEEVPFSTPAVELQEALQQIKNWMA